MKLFKSSIILIATVLQLQVTSSAFAEEELQDMSDPLAVYTQLGLGITDKGVNFKIGKTYGSDTPGIMAMNVVEFKGIAGELTNFRDKNSSLYANVDDSIDYFRFRNFQVDTVKYRGKQLDLNYDVDRDTLDASYSIIQALPPLSILSLFPLLGAGVTVADDVEEGYKIPGTFAVLGAYSKITFTENFWLNYNPMYMHTLSGSDNYTMGYYAGTDNILTHEFIVSYQFTPRFNVRYFANWNEQVSFDDGDHRIEFNYQI